MLEFVAASPGCTCRYSISRLHSVGIARLKIRWRISAGSRSRAESFGPSELTGSIVKIRWPIRFVEVGVDDKLIGSVVQSLMSELACQVERRKL